MKSYIDKEEELFSNLKASPPIIQINRIRVTQYYINRKLIFEDYRICSMD